MTFRSNGSATLDLASIRARLAGAHGLSAIAPRATEGLPTGSGRGPEYWRSLEELAETPAFKRWVEQEFGSDNTAKGDGLTRREFLHLSAVSLALAGLSACTKQPAETIVPYVYQPEGLPLGKPLFYATSMVLGGFATGVLVKNREGHPIKVEGNPEHPASHGGSTIWMQAALAELYAPERSQGVTYHGEVSTWARLLAELNTTLATPSRRHGRSLRVLSETITSPTLAAQLDELQGKFPEAHWHQYEPINRDHAHEGASLAFGQIVEAQHRFERAKIILSLDADFLCAHPMRLRYARDFIQGRRVSPDKMQMNRLYVLEPMPSLTGTKADHRLALEPGDIELAARVVAQQLGASVAPAPPSFVVAHGKWLHALSRDLAEHRGRSVVLAGEQQPPTVHALAHLLNERLGNVGETVVYSRPAEAAPVNQSQSLRELVEAMDAGDVETLLLLGGNPVYTSPSDLEFQRHLARVPQSIHLAPCVDETSVCCTWHVPETHFLECWGDARAFDGTVSMIQPLIAPLHGGKSAIEFIGALLRPELNQSDYHLLRRHWESRQRWSEFEKGWHQALHDGFIPDTAFPTTAVTLQPQNLSPTSAPDIQAWPAPSETVDVVIRPDSNLWDGRFASNGWLQELPRPLHKITWDNVACISPTLAEHQGLQNGDVIELMAHNRTVRAPVWILPGQAANSIGVTLGYGRTHAGPVGTGVGFNAYPLCASTAFWHVRGATLRRTAQRHELVSTQLHHALPTEERQIYRGTTLQEFQARPDIVAASTERPSVDETLYDPEEFKNADYQWGMAIDLSACIGCSACVVACQMENNIPVVGKREMGRGRDMHWIRIDTYHKGRMDSPKFAHMPVPCMHCEQAPCEVVCPVGATVHDHEGLNLQVYNRCVGTRYCSNNCPYKVRRFNFFQYADYGAAHAKPMHNPEVTVRWRGVMEKCTYCVQRISAGRIAAKEENRRVHDGEVQTACQQACPAEAIVFGDLNQPGSRVAQWKRSPRDYSMLGALNTRPRTTYLAQLENPNPEIESGHTPL